MSDIKKGIDYLSNEEKEVYYSYRVDFKKIEFMTGRILLKTLLSEILNINPTEIVFTKNKYGKIFIDDSVKNFNIINRGCFNLSHTDQMICCVITSQNNVGIDIENVRGNYLNTMDLIYTNEEKEYILKQSPIKRDYTFYELWTRKEAHLKALGYGLSVSPNTFSVPFGKQISTEFDWEYFTCSLLNKTKVLSVAIKRELQIKYNYRLCRYDFQKLYKLS